MRKQLISLTLATLLLHQPVVAQDQTETANNETLFGSLAGMLVGGLVGGPPGAVLGFASGAVIGDHKSQSRQLKEHAQYDPAHQSDQQHLQDQVQQHQWQFQQQKEEASRSLLALQQGFRFCLGFRTGSSQIEPKIAEQLNSLAEMLKAFPQFQLLIEAGADQRGSEAFNHELSRERAEAVARLLIDAGLARDRIATRYQGESTAEYPLNDAEGLAFDRMVQLTLIQGEAS
jgi:outer membrane protein OmpA-like peptidoglycan-associated protein